MVSNQLAEGGVGSPGSQCLAISRVKILPPRLISRYQCGITACVVGLELNCNANRMTEKQVEATKAGRHAAEGEAI